MSATKTTPAEAPQPAGTLELLDPAAVEIGENVRDDPETGQPFTDLVASIKELGVLEPLTAVRGADGTITIRDGQRRTLAARAAGLAQMPVYVREDTATTDKARTAERVTHQIVANDRRQPLSPGQRAKGMQELLLAGLTPTKVAKALTVPKSTVEAAAAAAASPQALAALDSAQLTIEQAATLAEFTDAADVEHLLAARSTTDFDHRVSALREQAATAAARAEAAKPYAAQGYTIFDTRPAWGEPMNRQRHDLLCNEDGVSAAADVPAQRPDLWAVWLDEAEAYVDSRTGELVDDNDIDWRIDADDHDAQPHGELLHPRFADEVTVFEPTYYCLDPTAVGLITYDQYRQSGKAGTAAGLGAGDAEARKEAERREKRKVVALNKLGAAATSVRQTWVTEKLLARKTPPKGAALFVAAQLAAHPHLLGGAHASSIAGQLLGLPEHSPIAKAVTDLPPTGDGRAAVIMLGLVLGAMEAETPKDAWRSGGGYYGYAKTYLQFLAANGYDLSDIEKVITGALKADKLYDKITSAAAQVDKVA